LDEAAGKEFVEKLWIGMADNIKRVDPKLETTV
jgi:hypothetical protein